MGMIKEVLKFKMYLITFAAGYIAHRCVSGDERYHIEREEHKPYVVDRITDTSLPIDEDRFQVGSVEYRIQGLLQEENLRQTLEDLTTKLSPEEEHHERK